MDTNHDASIEKVDGLSAEGGSSSHSGDREATVVAVEDSTTATHQHDDALPSDNAPSQTLESQAREEAPQDVNVGAADSVPQAGSVISADAGTTAQTAESAAAPSPEERNTKDKQGPVPARAHAKGNASAPTATATPSSASRRMRQSGNGRSVIDNANEAGLTEAMSPGWSQGGFVGMSTGLHLNGEQLTTAEENYRFRQRNKVRSTYRGPVHVAEDLHVPCHGCGGPVDPIRRVPVGALFFHPGCVWCYLCGRTSVTEAFQQVGTHQVICSHCAAKGHAPCVRKEEANYRGVVLGAIRGDPDKLLMACEADARLASQQLSVNQATISGAIAPSLTIQPVHTRRNTTRRSFALMQRQQYYTQNDRNILARLPAPPAKTVTSDRQVESDDACELAAIRARRRSSSTAGAGPLPKLTYN